MAALIIIFISLSLGTVTAINAGSLTYNLEFIEPVILLVFIFTIAKVWKVNQNIKVSKMKAIILSLSVLISSYSLLTFAWTQYGFSVIPGSIPLFYAFVTLVISLYYLNEKPNLYVICSRIFILCLFLQLIFNILRGFQTGAAGFYAVKAFASTLIGKSNFISFFFVFDLIYEFIARDKYWRIFLIINLLAVVLTVSRGAIVSLAIALIVFFVIALFNPNFNTKNLVLSFGFLGGLFLVFLLFIPSGRELFEGLSLGLKASTVGSRQLLWSEAFREIAHNPFGIGVVWRNNPHNFLLDSLRNLGLLFGVLYILVISSPLFYFLNPKITKYSNKTIAPMIAYLSVLVHSLIEVFFFTKISVVWAFMTLTFIFVMINKEQNDKKTYTDLAKQKYYFNNDLFEKFKVQD